tara:strand:- start:323 stop:1777 length:1455 start_codon:yes stop_codon:yes gene_type:complete
MKYFFQALAFGFLFFFAGCSKELEPSGLSDAEIIQMIQVSNLSEITKSDLPTTSQDVVNQDYFDYMDVATRQASGLGYEVALAGRGHRVGSRHEIYFNLEGRKLDPNDWGDKSGWGRDGYDREFGVKEDWRCFDLVFPLTFNMPDGSTVIIESDNENSWDEIKAWYEANPDSEEKPMMQFPVVIFYEEETITLSSSEELREAYSGCEPRRKRDDQRSSRQCFSLVYPVTYTMPDGSTMEVSGEDENSWSALKNWYNENSGYEEVMPELHYPVDIVFETEEGENIVTIHSEEEMHEAKEECMEEWGNRECFSLVYPVIYTMPDGSTIEVSEDDENGWSIIKNWYEENPDYEEVRPELNYPVDIIFETEEGENTVTIHSEEEMHEAKEDCRGEWEEGEDESDDAYEECYEIVLPLTMVMPDGSFLTVSEEVDWRNLELWYVENDSEEEPAFQFPLDIFLEEEQQVVTVNNQEEMEAIEQECWGDDD